MTPSRSNITKNITMKARNQAIWFHINNANVRLNVSSLFSFSTHLAFETNQRYLVIFGYKAKVKSNFPKQMVLKIQKVVLINTVVVRVE